MEEKISTPKEELAKASVNDTAPEGGMRKSIGDAQELLDKFKNKEPLTASEERLVDLLTFQKTGKHIAKFKDPKPTKPTYSIPTISKDTSFTAFRAEEQKPIKINKDIPLGPSVTATGTPTVSI